MSVRMRQSQIFEHLREDIDRKASEHYTGHEERILGHIGRIHNEAGPISGCDCPICFYYHQNKTTGPKHTKTGCACWVCEKARKLIAMSKGYKYIPHSRRKMGLRSKP